MSRRWGSVVAVCLLLGLAGGSQVPFASSATQSGQRAGADSASLFVAPSGSDAGRCTAVQPCKTMNRAYQIALPGQIVEVRGGEYPTQTLVARPAGPDGRVLFRAAVGARVTTQGLTFGVRGTSDPASHLTVDGQGRWTAGDIDFFLPNPEKPSTDVTIENLKLGRNSAIFLRGTDRTVLRNIEIGPSYCRIRSINVSNTNRVVTYRRCHESQH